ncbi:MAG: hypothetical protein ACW99G_04890 [Candidatus Thorarchaeota archaeon]|jgi:hypothetical protein
MPIRRTNTQYMDFQCPSCESNDLEEVCRALQYSSISGFYRSDSSERWYEDYWDTETEELETLRMQCQNCGLELCTGRPRNLFEFLNEKGWMVDRNAPAPTQQANWEV